MGTINKVFLYNGTPQNGAIAQLWKITAFAAYTDSTATVQDNPLNATDVECLTSNGAVFAVGDVTRMGTEYCLIWAKSGNTVYIIRGWHQSTPAQHNQNTVIYDEAITPPIVDDAVPGAGQQGGNITTGVAYGGDGAYRFDAVPEMEYYASVTYDAHITYVHCFVERNDITLEQLLTVDGDMIIRNADTVTRLPKGTVGQWLKTGANRPEWDTITAVATITIAETEVFNGNSPNGWTDLDLSGTIGVNAALVLLKIISPAVLQAIAVRKNGDADEFYSYAVAANDEFKLGGAALSNNANDTGFHQVLICVTDASGIIEWKTRAVQANTTVDIIAYIKGV